jgi:tetratricopeptide (TPR) repeat protein
MLADYATRLAMRRGFAWTCTAEYIKEIEVNDVRPDDEWRVELLCDLFELRREQLGFPPLPRALTGGQQSNKRVPLGASRRYDASAEDNPDSEDPMERRTAIKGLAGLLAVPVLDSAVQPLRRLAQMSLPRAVDGCEALVAQLGYGYSSEPPTRLLRRLRHLAAFSDAMSSVASSPHAVRFRSVAGWTTGLLANALFDTGDAAAADSTIRLVHGYGEQTGDARLIAYAYDRQAMMANERGDYPAALAFLDAGLRAAPQSTAIRVRLLWERASVVARLQQRERALADLKLVSIEHGRVPVHELNEGSFGVSVVTADRAAGEILSRLGDAAGARDSQERAIAHYQSLVGAEARPTRLAYIQLHMANGLVQLGEADHAVAIAAHALNSPRQVWDLQQRLAGFVTDLLERHPSMPEVRQFAEEYRALASA